jgi:hypothetical protein
VDAFGFLIQRKTFMTSRGGDANCEQPAFPVGSDALVVDCPTAAVGATDAELSRSWAKPAI